MKARLSSAASQSGVTVENLVQEILLKHVAELDGIEARWERYKETGQTVSVETVRARLKEMAEEAIRAQDNP